MVKLIEIQETHLKENHHDPETGPEDFEFRPPDEEEFEIGVEVATEDIKKLGGKEFIAVEVDPGIDPETAVYEIATPEGERSDNAFTKKEILAAAKQLGVNVRFGDNTDD